MEHPKPQNPKRSKPKAKGKRRGRAAQVKARINAQNMAGHDTSNAPKSGDALINPFAPIELFSSDYIESMHLAALETLERLGLKVLLPEARKIFKAGGAIVDEATEMVYLGRDLVEAALSTAPRRIEMAAGAKHRDLTLELGRLAFQPGAGAPYVTDCEQGRRPGSAEDFRNLVRLTQHFDALHMLPPLVEIQDVPTHLRHYASMEAMLTLSDKVPFIFSRGSQQVEESFEMIRDFRGLSDAKFQAQPHCYTIINTNSPRQIDIPMAQGLIDFARFGQMSIITPFTLMGAMAPVTVAGAITLSHAEAMAAITLTQLTKPGAPVCYGTFTSNVDMKSGAPAFGTPEHFQASVVAGQLARRIGLPWRSASGSAANINDAQAANETQFGMWGCLLAGATVIIHAAGWQEGGLTISFEKIITDMEVINMVAALCTSPQETEDNLGLSALGQVEPGGHFFGCAHTMARYQDAFYHHLVGDLSNHGSWLEAGGHDINVRATQVWKRIVEQEQSFAHIDAARTENLNAYIAHRTEAGGAPPVS